MRTEKEFQKKKSLGQHFLTSDIVPGWMCDASSIQKGETVLEIGPGTGMLTKEILLRGGAVVALEADTRALVVLREQFSEYIASGQLTLHHADARTLTVQTYGLVDHAFKVVSNIPYYLSGSLFRTLLESKIQPSCLVFLVQKEVAHRIAKDKKESLLSLSVKAFGTPRYVKTVTKGHFSPQPKVDSAIIAITNIHRHNFTTFSSEFFFTLLHLGFGQKRKQLLGNLAQKYNRNELTHIFSTLTLPHDIRAEDISVSQWLLLAQTLFEKKQ